MTTKDIEDWMRANKVKRIVRMNPETGGGWCLYRENEATFWTGETIADALADAEIGE